MIDVYSSKKAHFVRSLAKASTQLDKTKILKKELNQRVQSVKKMAEKPGTNKSLKQELEKLERAIMGVASLEKEILRKEDKDIKGLKSQIAELKTRLALMGTGHLRLSLEKISYLLAELTARMDTYVNIKTEREKRFIQLEEKINQKLQTSLSEIFNLEKSIVSLEKRYEEIKNSGKTNEEHLQRIEDRITELREKLIAKKVEAIEKKETEMKPAPFVPKMKRPEMPPLPPKKPSLPLFPKPLPALPRQQPRPIPPPKMIFPGETKAPPIQHKIMFPEMPPLPKGPEEDIDIEIPPPPVPLERKGFRGWLKGLFGK